MTLRGIMLKYKAKIGYEPILLQPEKMETETAQLIERAYKRGTQDRRKEEGYKNADNLWQEHKHEFLGTDK